MANSRFKVTRHNIYLREGDYAAIQAIYGNRAAEIIRALVRDFVENKLPIIAARNDR